MENIKKYYGADGNDKVLPLMNKAINIIFDGPPSHTSGRFVEIELDNGKSIRIGEWIKRDDDLWSLRITELPKVSDND